MTEEERYMHMFAMKCLDAALYEMDQRNYETAHVLATRFCAYNAFDEIEESNMKQGECFKPEVSE